MMIRFKESRVTILYEDCLMMIRTRSRMMTRAKEYRMMICFKKFRMMIRAKERRMLIRARSAVRKFATRIAV